MVCKWHLLPAIFTATGALLVAASASASPATLKCNPNQDQIWVYDSLSNFNVDVKLKCGQGVEIIERVQGYVKIRAQNGVIGYVPDTAISDLPPFQPYRDPAHDVGLAARQAQATQTAKAAANAAVLAPADVNYSRAIPASGSVTDRTSLTVAQSSLATATIVASSAYGTPKTAPLAASASNPAPGRLSTSVAPNTPVKMSKPTPVSAAVRPPAEPSNGAAITRANDSHALSAPSVDATSETDSTTNEQPAGACQSYFSAYGLTPSQIRWIAQTREKAFANICPASSPSMVDFVMIFTHDADFFSGTMPTPIHKSDGFSDFSPITPLDTALIPLSQADSARREYAWVFQFEKGTFDPGSFSPQRQYQFSKVEKGSVKAIEDAFRFLESTSR